jgi:CheY-like chemotaxis protein
MDDAETQFLARYSVLPTVRAAGCDACDHIGYSGRVPINEVLILDEATRTLISNAGTTADIQRASQAAGMRLLRESALDLIAQGITTVDEIHRVLGEELEEPSEAPAVPVSQPAPPPPNAPPSAPPAAAWSPEEEEEEAAPRALVVDDDSTTRTVVRGLLESLGMVVQDVADGTDALRVLKADPDWDLMMLDLDMPLLDGRDVLRVLRASISTASLPVIVLTGSPDPDTESEVLELGADDYIRKPIDPIRVLGRIKATLRRSAVYAGAS